MRVKNRAQANTAKYNLTRYQARAFDANHKDIASFDLKKDQITLKKFHRSVMRLFILRGFRKRILESSMYHHLQEERKSHCAVNRK